MKIWHMGLGLGFMALAALAGASEGAPSAGTASPASTTPAPNTLTDNVALHFVGTLWAGAPMDVTLTGIGPTFNASLITQPGDNPLIMTMTAAVHLATGGYLADLTFGQNIPTQSPGNANQVAITYRNISTQVSVLLKPGQPALVLDGNGQKMTVTLTTVPAGAPVASTKLPALGADGSLDENLKISLKGVWLDGKPMDYSALTASDTFNANVSIPDVAVTPTGSMSALDTFSLKFAPAPGGGYVVNFTLGERFPAVLQSLSDPSGRSSTSSVTTRNITYSGAMVVPSLDQPIEVFSDGGAKLILTLSRPPAK